MKGKKKTDIILIIIFLVGLSVLLYPTISNYYNSFHESKVIAAYETNLSKMTETDYSGALQKASDYNSTLSAGTQSFESGEPVDSTYSSLLNLSDDGMMGYITISKLDVELPIYHGTSDSVLAAAVQATWRDLPCRLAVSAHTVSSWVTADCRLPSCSLILIRWKSAIRSRLPS
jgi:sortase (surface protein transpeptidase)